MSRTGTINIIDEKENVQIMRRYISLPRAMTIILDLQKLYNVRMEKWFIHVIPDPVEEPEKKCETKIEDMNTIKVSEEQKAFIQANMDSKTPLEMSLEIDLTKEAIRYWTNKFRHKPFVHKIILAQPEETKKQEPRPPALYSNRDHSTLYL